MFEIKWEPYDEQDSPFYVPPKPKDYYISKGIWDSKPKQETHSSSLADFLGMAIPSKKDSNY